ncbi:aldehyde dehydrogenase family protein [Sphingobium tyrosinilyticum]|uniref:Aldehyde dehydrogenase family protein n=1 Tax=Sphingobium tyrosinilyticum TaxID=2715436 RepID=A0ABV9F2E3_9SPHN
MATSHKLLIDGKLVDGEETLDVINPATGDIFCTVPRASTAQAEAAIAAAKRAHPGWAATPVAERGALLSKFADAIAARTEELARVLVQEQGKPLAQAMGEVGYAAFFVRHFAKQELKPQVLQDDAAYHIEVHHKPLGVVAGITPWNFPFLMPIGKIAPALITGNCFILKPAPTTPVVSLLIGEIAAEIFPAGVFSVLVDNNDLGPLLTSHPDVAKVSFTGSTPTGRKIMQSAASTLKRLTLELGGNDAAIVLDDADVEKAAKGIAGAAFMNAGQVCIAVKRAYVHDAVYDAMCEALAKAARDMHPGNGLEQGVTMGPIQNRTQFEKAKQYLNVARRDGTVIAGGKAQDGKGYFIEPTVVRDITDGSPLVDEEQFSPILPVIRFDDLDAVIATANASEFGLGGSVWSTNIERATDIAQRIESGTVWVNHASHLTPAIPFGGAKQSGLGVEYGQEGLEEYTQKSVISIAH